VTAINCILQPGWVAVATDTLTTDTRDWGPFMLTAKAHFFPPAEALFACTGAGQMMTQAFNWALVRSITDVDALCAALPEVIRAGHAAGVEAMRARQTDDDHEWESGGKLFVFGWSATAGRFVGYRFSVADGCAAEKLGDGPHRCPAQPEEIRASLRQPPDLCRLTAFQQTEELRKAPEDRNLIGGHLMLYMLVHSPAGVVGQVQRVHPLENFADDQRACQGKWADLMVGAGASS